jgi:alpha-ketoglutarate-dependent taurine dioxygenase
MFSVKAVFDLPARARAAPVASIDLIRWKGARPVEFQVEPIKPGVGVTVRTDRTSLFEPGVSERCLELIEQHGAIVFPRLGLTDAEQLKFTDSLGQRVNFQNNLPGDGEAMKDVYTITLDPKINTEPEYVLGSWFWHLDGACSDIPMPRVTLLSCRKPPPAGTGQTEFANTFSAYDALPDDEKKALAGLRVMHSVTAAVREVAAPGELDPTRAEYRHEHPLVWEHASGRKSLMIGYTADYIVGMTKAESRALLARLLDWTAQPAFSCRHNWSEGDFAMWNNRGVLHRALPYKADCGRNMHRTSVSGLPKAA